MPPLRLFTPFPWLMSGLFIIFALPLLFQTATAAVFSTSSGYARYGSLLPRSFRSMATPPVAKKVRHEMEMFGDVRVDDYYWLRDNSRSNPEVLSYLQAENNYTDQAMSSVKEFENQLLEEMRARFIVDYVSVPFRRGAYYYYWKSLEEKDKVLYRRRLVTNDSSTASVHDVMPTGPGALDEQVILDINILAQGHDFYNFGNFKLSPNNKFIAYSEDTNGDEIYNINIIDIEKGTAVGNSLKGTTSIMEWGNNDTLIYATMDEYHRPYKIWSHQLLSNQSSDQCLYHEKDDKFYLYFYTSGSNQYIFVGSSSLSTTSMFYLDISKHEGKLMTLTPRIFGTATSVASHRGNHFFIKKRNEENYNSELIAFPIGNPSKIEVLIQHRERVQITGYYLFSNHIAVYERENGLPKITIYGLPPLGEPLRPLQDGQAIDFVEPAYNVAFQESEFSSSILRLSYSSMITPPTVYDYDMNLGMAILKQRQQVLGGFKSFHYLAERKWAIGSDGTKVPISILYKRNVVKLDGSDPLLLHGFGSYGANLDPGFPESRLSLVDRGFIYAIAHIRGGGEMGRKWYDDGKLLKKKNSFTDFITCAEFLIENKYSSKGKLSIHGYNAGGLLIGAVINMRPDLFKVAIAEVPVVDVVTNLFDPTIPFTTTNWEEFGDPRKEDDYYYIKSYSPIDNIKMQNYPNLLVTANLNDPLVIYSDPTKYVAKLRATKSDDNILLFKCAFGTGHSSKARRTQELQDATFINVFLLKELNMTPSIPPS